MSGPQRRRAKAEAGWSRGAEMARGVPLGGQLSLKHLVVQVQLSPEAPRKCLRCAISIAAHHSFRSSLDRLALRQATKPGTIQKNLRLGKGRLDGDFRPIQARVPQCRR